MQASPLALSNCLTCLDLSRTSLLQVKKRKQKQLFQAGTLESPAETEQKKRKKKMNKDMPVIAA